MQSAVNYANSDRMQIADLALDEIDAVNGGIYSAQMALIGFGATIIGGGIAVAGMGTPITIAGAALAAEGAAALSVGLSN